MNPKFPWLYAGVFLVLLVTWCRVTPQASPSPPTVNCAGGGLVYQSPSGAKHCVDPAYYLPASKLPPPPVALTGVPCAAPLVGSPPNVYAGFPDGTCLVLKSIPPPGSIASPIVASSQQVAMADLPVTVFYQFLFSTETPLPGSNLCPDPTGLAFQTCQPGQTPP